MGGCRWVGGRARGAWEGLTLHGVSWRRRSSPAPVCPSPGWGIETWDGLYEDLPSRQTKLAVKDRTAITTTEDETATISPPELQPELDALAAKYGTRPKRGAATMAWWHDGTVA